MSTPHVPRGVRTFPRREEQGRPAFESSQGDFGGEAREGVRAGARVHGPVPGSPPEGRVAAPREAPRGSLSLRGRGSPGIPARPLLLRRGGAARQAIPL